MAIYTPRGLKIRLSLDYAFALMARLYPSYDAFKILQTTEAIEIMPKAFAAVAGITCFLLHSNWLTIGIITFLAAALAHFLDNIGLIIKSFIPIGIIYSRISGYGILLVGIAILGYSTVGWKGVVAFFVAKLIIGALASLLGFWQAGKVHQQTGSGLTASERHFFHSYRIYAIKTGNSINLEVQQDELEEDNWKPVFLDLAQKWPEVVGRFTSE